MKRLKHLELLSRTEQINSPEVSILLIFGGFSFVVNSIALDDTIFPFAK
jgi:hypothetical protein